MERETDPLRRRLAQRGFVHPSGEPNYTKLAAEMQVAVETARRLILGIGKATPDTIRAAVEVLGSDVEDWLGASVAGGPYSPPSEAAFLTDEERRTIDQLIRLLATTRRREHEAKMLGITMSTYLEEFAFDFDRARADVNSHIEQLRAARRVSERSPGHSVRRAQDEVGQGSQDEGGIDPL